MQRKLDMRNGINITAFLLIEWLEVRKKEKEKERIVTKKSIKKERERNNGKKEVI